MREGPPPVAGIRVETGDDVPDPLVQLRTILWGFPELQELIIMRYGRILVVSAALTALAMPAFGQGGGQGRDRGPGGRQGGAQRQRAPRMTPEQSKNVWTLEAHGVASGLGLSDEAAKQLVAAYIGARQDFRKATEAARSDRRGNRGAGAGAEGERPRRDRGEGAERGEGRGGGGDAAGRGGGRRGGRAGGGQGGGFGAANIEMRTKAQAGLRTTLTGFLSAEQTESALKPLGTFDPNWDRLVHAIVGFELGDEKTTKALVPIQTYVTSLATARESRDREGMQAARDTLGRSMQGILDEEQMIRFVRLTQPTGRQGRRSMDLMQYDENGDGKIQRDELPERMQRMFDRMDENGDGEISKEEIEAMSERFRGGRRGGGRGGSFDDPPF